MIALIRLFQKVNIEEKLKEAPDSSCRIGVFIGPLLPFVVLVVITYTIFRYNKNRIKDE